MDKECIVYRKEYKIKRLMAFENMAVGDVRKLVYIIVSRRLSARR